jgi:lysophospholipid acyltransferase (LPLAT)-like uncharacterized protein
LRDESFGAEVTAWLLTFVGRETRPLRWRDPISRAADLREVIRRREPVAFAVDGHGPYGRVGPGFPRLLERMGAAAVPVAARVSRKIPVRLRATFDVPLPGTRLAVLVGKPVHPETAGPALLETLQASLDALGHEAERALRSSALT